MFMRKLLFWVSRCWPSRLRAAERKPMSMRPKTKWRPTSTPRHLLLLRPPPLPPRANSRAWAAQPVACLPRPSLRRPRAPRPPLTAPRHRNKLRVMRLGRRCAGPVDFLPVVEACAAFAAVALHCQVFCDQGIAQFRYTTGRDRAALVHQTKFLTDTAGEREFLFHQ